MFGCSNTVPLDVSLTKSVDFTVLIVFLSMFDRYQFFLQVKKDILQGRLPVTTELAAELAALALQCKSTFIF